MDYRALALDRVTWVDSKVWYGGAGKVVFQTPLAACTIGPNAKWGPHAYTLDLRFQHAGFKAFVRALQQTVPHSIVGTLRASEAIEWDGRMRLATFGETTWFAADGTHTPDPPDQMETCMCVLQLVGLWMSHASGTWGLKWRVPECKASSRELEDVPLFRDDDGEEVLLFRDA